MPNSESTELMRYVSELAHRTRDGGIEWTRVNPTTLIWDGTGTGGLAGRITLQLVEQRKLVRLGAGVQNKKLIHYVFQVTDRGSGKALLSVTGEDDSALNNALEQLYDAAKSGVTRKGLDYLKGLLG